MFTALRRRRLQNLENSTTATSAVLPTTTSTAAILDASQLNLKFVRPKSRNSFR